MKYTYAAWLTVLSVIVTPISGSPVERVVHLLEDLRSKLELDDQQEQQMYDKYACWCEKTTARKANDIETAQKSLRALGQTILSLKGKIATLTSEIDALTAQINEIEQAMKKATSIRQKENGAYMAESEEVKSCLTTLQDAIKVLIAGTEEKKSGAFLQSSARAAAAVKNVIAAIPSNAAMKPDQFDHLSMFVQAGGNMKYAPQSFTVQGILVDMYTTFASDLESATSAESAANRQFEQYMHLKATDKAAKEKQRREKRATRAEAEAQLADTQAIYDETDAQRQADIKFFDETKEACMNKHSAWTLRHELREEEIRGVEGALAILTTDENRQRFATHMSEGKETGMDNSYDTGRDISFVQINSHSVSTAAQAAANAFAALKEQASKTHSLRLAALAARLSLTKKGHFEDVIAEIDRLLGVLTTEGQDDVKKRDQCKDEYQKIESAVKNITWLIKNNDAKITKLANLIALRKQQRQETLDSIAETNQYKIDLTSERTAENQKFQSDKTADQQNIDALMDARDLLQSYYSNHSIDMGPIQGSVKALAFAQQGPDFDISADQAPDTVFSGKGKRKNESKDIISILTMIIEDTNDEIKNSMKAEEQAQLEYEALIDEANKLLKSLNAKKVSLDVAISKREGEKTDEETDRTNNKADLQAEIDYKASITNDCDFIIRTFEKRAAARTAEMEGLTGAKEFLVGATTPAPGLLQTVKGSYDDGALPSARFLGLGQ